jgi:pyruvate ferredoxin oxidoreductase gamma subunit
MLVEIRWHGRGGQGAVTASQLVAVAAIREGKFALAFPEFGAERRGAPVKAYTRITDETALVPRSPIVEPDIVVVLDPSLLTLPMVPEGLKKNGMMVVNTSKKPDDIRKIVGRDDIKVAVVNATRIAMDTLGRPIVNTAILGALVKASGVVSLDTLLEAVRERFGFSEKLASSNVEAVKRAYEEVEVG